MIYYVHIGHAGGIWPIFVQSKDSVISEPSGHSSDFSYRTVEEIECEEVELTYKVVIEKLYYNEEVSCALKIHGYYPLTFDDTQERSLVFHSCFRMENGAYYEGMISLDTNRPEGKGIMVWPDGSVYEGKFSKGIYNGYGRLIDK